MLVKDARSCLFTSCLLVRIINTTTCAYLIVFLKMTANDKKNFPLNNFARSKSTIQIRLLLKTTPQCRTLCTSQYCIRLIIAHLNLQSTHKINVILRSVHARVFTMISFTNSFLDVCGVLKTSVRHRKGYRVSVSIEAWDRAGRVTNRFLLQRVKPK